MGSTVPRPGSVLAMLAVCVGLVVLGTGCPQPTPCTDDTDCDDGLYCNGDETCVDGVCVDGTSPCTADQECDEDADVCIGGPCQTDADCPEGEFCDVATGECVENVNLYETTYFSDDGAGGPVHTAHADGGIADCTSCHHSEPAAGFVVCATCHSEDPDEANSFKIVAHDLNESGGGCRSCHDDDFDNCAYCHDQF